MYKALLLVTKSQGFRQSSLMIIGNITAASFSAIALMLISRNLGPIQFGYFSVGFSLVLILSRIIDAGLTQTVMRFIPQETDPAKINRIISFATQVKLIVYFIVAISGILITPLISNLIGFEKPIILVLAFILSFATVGFEHVVGVLQALHRFGASVTSNLIQASGKLIGAITLALINPGATVTTFVAYMIAPVAPVILARKIFPSEIKINLWNSYAPEKTVLKKMAGHAAIGYVAAGLIENIDMFFVQSFTTPFDTGLYGGALRISMLFMVLAFSLANVLNPRVARYTKVNHLSKYLKKAFIIALLAIIAGLILLPFSGMIIHLTIGPEYVGAATSLQILIASSFVTIAGIPFIALFFAFNKAEWYFSISGLLQLVVVILGNLIFVPTYGIEAAAWTRLASKVMLFGFTFGLGWWYYRQMLGNANSNSSQH